MNNSPLNLYSSIPDAPPHTNSKRGFAVPLTYEALEGILRNSFDLPSGDLVDVAINRERDIVTFKFRGGTIVIGEAGEYPHRPSLVTSHDLPDEPS